MEVAVSVKGIALLPYELPGLAIAPGHCKFGVVYEVKKVLFSLVEPVCELFGLMLFSAVLHAYLPVEYMLEVAGEVVHSVADT